MQFVIRSFFKSQLFNLLKKYQGIIVFWYLILMQHEVLSIFYMYLIYMSFNLHVLIIEELWELI